MKDNVTPKLSSIKGRVIEDLTADFFLLGTQIRKQINKFIIAKGGPWASLAFLFNDGQDKIMLASFRTDGEFYKRYSYFIIRNKAEALKIIDFIKECYNV